MILKLTKPLFLILGQITYRSKKCNLFEKSENSKKIKKMLIHNCFKIACFYCLSQIDFLATPNACKTSANCELLEHVFPQGNYLRDSHFGPVW